MLSERIENIKQKSTNVNEKNLSSKNINMILKENQVQFNVKDLLIKTNKIYISEPPN